MFFLQQLFNGLSQGMIYALMAIGYAVIFGVVGLVTFTHGDVIMIGAFASYYYFVVGGSNIVVALLVGFLSSGLLGIFVHKICYERFLYAPRYISLICTIGMAMFLRNTVQIIAGAETKGMPEVFESRFIAISDFRISFLQILIFAIVILLSISLSLFLNRTRMGLSLRAVSMNKKAASLLGIHIGRTTLIGNCIGCALGGVAGVLLGLYYNSVTPNMGPSAGMKAFSAAVLGGLSSVPGAAIGGILIGIFENFGIVLFSAGLRDAIAFIFLIAVLVIRPQGLFRKKGVSS
jgi:branched-chain amino acid transport system permease protein